MMNLPVPTDFGVLAVRVFWRSRKAEKTNHAAMTRNMGSSDTSPASHLVYLSTRSLAPVFLQQTLIMLYTAQSVKSDTFFYV